jgi:hypothetical protein
MARPMTAMSSAIDRSKGNILALLKIVRLFISFLLFKGLGYGQWADEMLLYQCCSPKLHILGIARVLWEMCRKERQ